MVDPIFKPVLNRHFRLQWEPIQDAFVLLYPEGMVKLSPSAAEILKACDGCRSVEEIGSELQRRYPDADNLKEDVEDFLNGAKQRGWTEFV